MINQPDQQKPYTKKIWQKPEFYILGSNNIEVKNQAGFREHTLAPFLTPGHNNYKPGNGGAPFLNYHNSPFNNYLS